MGMASIQFSVFSIQTGLARADWRGRTSNVQQGATSNVECFWKPKGDGVRIANGHQSTRIAADLASGAHTARSKEHRAGQSWVTEPRQLFKAPNRRNSTADFADYTDEANPNLNHEWTLIHTNSGGVGLGLKDEG
jgi:hypothetical protein